MLYLAFLFFIVAIVAAVLGLGGVSAAVSQVAWILFAAGLILAVIFLIIGCRSSKP
ncbi:DUF1328 domain-containing protein [Candidatus Nitrotoga sp. M5]|uniref:DUF1328 domain-containing protein n=1 Tax=Candidatus Nitrotoga sp. M5 TaxID=2890409 RepID=UPI001EF19D71|nr:DUF1328 domain-containing protein [Candidatus Nitrotoga sp. M5]CAH1385346.1 conserved hypothetical protein [Candidatus Nitrotoga sp. M5]